MTSRTYHDINGFKDDAFTLAQNERKINPIDPENHDVFVFLCELVMSFEHMRRNVT